MDNIFFWFSKIGWAIFAPDRLLLLILLVGCILLWCRMYTKAKILFTVLAAALILLTIFPAGEWLAYPLEKRFQTNPALDDKVDGIIVLAGPENAKLSALWQQMEFRDGAERYTAFMMLARRYPHAALVFTGGSGSLTKQEYKAADYAREFFIQQGMDIGRITFERESRNTYENALYSKELVAPRAGEQWVLVTSAMHMPRSVGIFCKLDWPVIPYPVDHMAAPDFSLSPGWALAAHLNDFVWAIHEWIGLTVYYLSGKTTELLPDSC